MPRKSNPKRKGLFRGVLRHRIKAKSTSLQVDASDPNNGRFLGLKGSTLSRLAELSFDTLAFGCETIGCTPLIRSRKDRQFHVASKAKRWGFFVLMTLFGIWWIHRIRICFMLFGENDLSAGTFICIAYFILTFLPWTIALGITFHSQDAVDMVRSGQELLDYTGEVQGYRLKLFGDPTLCLLIMLNTSLAPSLFSTGAFTPLFLDTLPSTVFGTLKGLGMIPDLGISSLTWQIIFIPVEGLISIWPLLQSLFTINMLLLGICILKTLANEITKINVVDMASRNKAEHLYVCLELFTRVLSAWVKVSLPLILFGDAVAAIVTIAVTLRFASELPLLVYLIYPTVGINVLFTIYSILYEAVCLNRVTEGILAQLTAHDAAAMRNIPRPERVEIMKRAKGMKPVSLPIGLFTREISVGLIYDIWDEIINQILFLFSL